MKKILKMFGLMTTADHNSVLATSMKSKDEIIQSKNIELQNAIISRDEVIAQHKNKIAELEVEFNSVKEFKTLFSKPVADMSYQDFEKSRGYVRTFSSTKYWNEYWADQLRAKYCAWYFRNISKYPELLEAFLLALVEFPWDVCVENYKKSNWTWSDKTVTPTKAEMIDCVVGLLNSSIEHLTDDKKSGSCSSGGFLVEWTQEDKQVKLLIKNETIAALNVFKKNDSKA